MNPTPFIYFNLERYFMTSTGDTRVIAGKVLSVAMLFGSIAYIVTKYSCSNHFYQHHGTAFNYICSGRAMYVLGMVSVLSLMIFWRWIVAGYGKDTTSEQREIFHIKAWCLYIHVFCIFFSFAWVVTGFMAKLFGGLII